MIPSQISAHISEELLARFFFESKCVQAARFFVIIQYSPK